jgi:hypothetical protein
MHPDYAKVVNALADAVKELNVETPAESIAAADAAAAAAAAEHSAHSAMSTSRHKIKSEPETQKEKNAAAQKKPDQAHIKPGPDKATQSDQTGRKTTMGNTAALRAAQAVYGVLCGNTAAPPAAAPPPDATAAQNVSDDDLGTLASVTGAI